MDSENEGEDCVDDICLDPESISKRNAFDRASVLLFVDFLSISA